MHKYHDKAHAGKVTVCGKRIGTVNGHFGRWQPVNREAPIQPPLPDRQGCISASR